MLQVSAGCEGLALHRTPVCLEQEPCNAPCSGEWKLWKGEGIFHHHPPRPSPCCILQHCSIGICSSLVLSEGVCVDPMRRSISKNCSFQEQTIEGADSSAHSQAIYFAPPSCRMNILSLKQTATLVDSFVQFAKHPVPLHPLFHPRQK